MTTAFQRELQTLRPDDEVQGIADGDVTDTYFIYTAGHGYLAVPKGHANYRLASNLVSFGYRGRYAIYLEEDCEAPTFTRSVLSAN